MHCMKTHIYVHITCIVHVPNLCRGGSLNNVNCCKTIMSPNISCDSVRAGMISIKMPISPHFISDLNDYCNYPLAMQLCNGMQVSESAVHITLQWSGVGLPCRHWKTYHS